MDREKRRKVKPNCVGTQFAGREALDKFTVYEIMPGIENYRYARVQAIDEFVYKAYCPQETVCPEGKKSCFQPPWPDATQLSFSWYHREGNTHFHEPPVWLRPSVLSISGEDQAVERPVQKLKSFPQFWSERKEDENTIKL